MPKFLKKCLMLTAAYLLAWLLAFVVLVGFEPGLVVRYFISGWTFTGMELPAFVWLLSWPALGGVLFAYVFATRRRHTRQRHAKKKR